MLDGHTALRPIKSHPDEGTDLMLSIPLLRKQASGGTAFLGYTRMLQKWTQVSLHVRDAEHFTTLALLTLALKLPERQTTMRTDNSSGSGLLPDISKKNVDCKYQVFYAIFRGNEVENKLDSIGLGELNETRDSAPQGQWPLTFTSHKYFCKSMLLTAPK